MSQISVSNMTFCYEGSFDNIFEKVSFLIDTDWKLGFVGRNGKGKTTFLNLLLGNYEYEGNISASVAFDYFPYQITKEQTGQCGAEFLGQLKQGCELWRVIYELDKLQLDAEILYRPFGTLSHGERTKVMLAVLFSGESRPIIWTMSPERSLRSILGRRRVLFLCPMTGIFWMPVSIMYLY